MKLVIIGSGNVANVLGRMLFAAGHEIMQVVGRNQEAVQVLANSLQADACFDQSEIAGGADLYLFALSDAALYQLDEQPGLKNGICVHTAGSVPATVFSRISRSFGVLYPLQTMKKGDDPGQDIPFLINGNTHDVIQIISRVASTISSSVKVLDDDRRAKIHLAAAIVNNFSNHLFALAYDFCESEELDYSLLGPLISLTAKLAGQGDPALLQTGPAARKDFITMEKHEKLLSDYPVLKKIYQVMSESIISRN